MGKSSVPTPLGYTHDHSHTRYGSPENEVAANMDTGRCPMRKILHVNRPRQFQVNVAGSSLPTLPQPTRVRGRGTAITSEISQCAACHPSCPRPYLLHTPCHHARFVAYRAVVHACVAFPARAAVGTVTTATAATATTALCIGGDWASMGGFASLLRPHWPSTSTPMCG